MSYLSAIPVTCSSTFILLARALSEKQTSTTGIAQSIGSTALRVGMHATSKQFHAVADAVRRRTSERQLLSVQLSLFLSLYHSGCHQRLHVGAEAPA